MKIELAEDTNNDDGMLKCIEKQNSVNEVVFELMAPWTKDIEVTRVYVLGYII